MRQVLVQNSGSMTAFNYAYCKTIYDQACRLLKTDVVDANGENFFIIEADLDWWIEYYQKIFYAAEKAISDLDENEETEEEKSENRKAINASQIMLEKGSLLPALVEHLEEQTKLKSCIRFPSSCYVGLEQVKKFKDDISLFFGQVKDFLAMFE